MSLHVHSPPRTVSEAGSDKHSLSGDLPLETSFSHLRGEWQVRFRQQPQRARMSGFKSLMCRSMDPTPIIELKGQSDLMATEHFFLVCTVSLCNVNGTIIPPGNASRVILNGDTVYNLHCLQDIDKTNSYFFVFNNLGVSTPGRYRLLVKIFDIRTGFGPRGQALSSLYSDVFEILSPGRFKGLSVSTELMKNFRRQGILISLRPDKNSQ